MSAAERRELPTQPRAERSILGSILIDGTLLSRAQAIIEPEDFANEAHRTIYGAMLRLAGRHEGIDLVTTLAELGKTGHLERAGGDAYVSGLTDGASVDLVPDHARLVREASKQRQEITALRRRLAAFERGEAIVAPAEPKGSTETPSPWIDLKTLRDELRIIATTRLSTGFPTFDAALGGGLPGGTLTLALGPPGSTKSAALFQIGFERARETNQKFYVYAPDQGGMQPLQRVASAYGNIAENDVAFAQFCVEVEPFVRVADERLPRMSLETFRDAVVSAGDAGAVLIDTPQTAATAADEEGERARIDAAMEIAGQLARTLLIPVLVSSHANRAGTAARRPEDRTHPRAAGLGSAKLEHRAQVIVFMEKIDRDDGQTEVEVLVVKVTFGTSGQRFRIMLDPGRWTLREVDRAASELEEQIHAEAEAEERRHRAKGFVLDLLKRFPDGLSGAQVEKHVKAKAADVREALQELHRMHAVIAETRTGRGGGILWKVAR